LGGQLDLADRSPGLGHGRERRLFEVGGAGDGADEIGNEVGPALIDVLDLGPLRVGRLLPADEPVVGAHRPQADDQSEDHEETEDGEEDLAGAHVSTTKQQ